jgi:ubiquinone/menaquinone biosynthesis C-methylase UbiE
LEFDLLAEHYDATRGGEGRGDEYASELDPLLGPADGLVLEIGVGTGVVALGLVRRGRRVVGLDVSLPMLSRAKSRLGQALVQSDATQMAIATSSVDCAVSVWVLHAVKDPTALFREAARVIRPGGSYVVCTAQHAASDDVVGRIIKDMSERVDERRRALRPRGVSIEEVIEWALPAGFRATVRHFDRTWASTKDEELYAIENRVWPALRELDDTDAAEVTAAAIDALRVIPKSVFSRRATADVVVFDLP